MNAKHALTLAVAMASFASIPVPTSAQTYDNWNERFEYGYREDPGYYYPRDSYDTYRSDRDSQPAPVYTPADPAYNSAYSYPASASARGTVESVEVVAQRGHGSGAGAVIGGIAGGLIGSQIGSGSGNAAATIGGALGGAYLGNEVERRRAADETYRFNVRMDDGSLRAFTQDTPEIRVGSRVRMTDDGQIVLS